MLLFFSVTFCFSVSFCVSFGLDLEYDLFLRLRQLWCQRLFLCIFGVNFGVSFAFHQAGRVVPCHIIQVYGSREIPRKTPSLSSFSMDVLIIMKLKPNHFLSGVNSNMSLTILCSYVRFVNLFVGKKNDQLYCFPFLIFQLCILKQYHGNCPESIIHLEKSWIFL